MKKRIAAAVAGIFYLMLATTVLAEPTRILWWDGSPIYDGATSPEDRKVLAHFVDVYAGGPLYKVDYVHSLKGGEFAQQMAQNSYDIIVLDSTTQTAQYSGADLAAFQSFYRSGRKALMLDGTLMIRNSRLYPKTNFPGPNGAPAGLLINQIKALKLAGGGLLLGTDHGAFQAGVNQVLNALIPGASFSGTTNPSRDGDFIGDILLESAQSISPLDILIHWEAAPSQGQAPVGLFRNFLGESVELYSLVEISDKPGGRVKRPYISSTIDPGNKRRAIDGAQAPETIIDNMPTRKSLPTK